MIIKSQVPFYQEIFSIDGFLQGPMLMLGVQYVHEECRKVSGFNYRDLKELLQAKSLKNISTTDPFDPDADYRFDLNEPIPKDQQQKYKTVIDIGTLEHIFDTRQALENSLKFVALDGYYLLQTPVNGFYRHGLHTFNPECLQDALTLNGFEIVYKKYCSTSGKVLKEGSHANNSVIWLIGKKVKEVEKFAIPQQRCWEDVYYVPAPEHQRVVPLKVRRFLIDLLPPFLVRLVQRTRARFQN